MEGLEQSRVKAKFLQVDVTKKVDIEKLREHLQTVYGGLDVLINNTGVYWPMVNV